MGDPAGWDAGLLLRAFAPRVGYARDQSSADVFLRQVCWRHAFWRFLAASFDGVIPVLFLSDDIFHLRSGDKVDTINGRNVNVFFKVCRVVFVSGFV